MKNSYAENIWSDNGSVGGLYGRRVNVYEFVSLQWAFDEGKHPDETKPILRLKEYDWSLLSVRFASTKLIIAAMFFLVK